MHVLSLLLAAAWASPPPVAGGGGYDLDGDGVPAPYDCDDTDPDRYPGATEFIADGVDSDCDQLERCYADNDLDGYGVYDGATVLIEDWTCSEGSGGAAEPGDCDDERSTVYPGAYDTPGDGIDQDCDTVDSCYLDEDGDGYGDDSGVVVDGTSLDCLAGGFAVTADDCDDGDAGVNPDAPELPADGVDSNCTGIELCYEDLDGDGVGTTATVVSEDVDCVDAGESTASDDCNDFDDLSYPGAPEVPQDGIDQDCDGFDLVACYEDNDGDGIGGYVAVYDSGECQGGTVAVTGDCDDGNADIFPGADEGVADGIDSDCDGQELCYDDADDDAFGDEGDLVTSSDLDCAAAGVSDAAGDCDDSDAAINPDAVEISCNSLDDDCDAGTPDSVDLDGDGSDSCVDCDDGDAGVYPGAEEVVADGIDQDCDLSDACYVDADLDGVGTGDPVAGPLDCVDPGWSDRGDDCDDSDDTIAPTLSELTCDGIDQDCDPYTADDPDADGDGYTFCVDDCDDADPLVNPGRYEVACNLIDDDCDPSTPDGDDADGDGAALCAGDCNDNDADISPLLEEETCTGIDEDCDPLTPDEPDVDADGISVCEGDCDDTDPLVNPGVPEVPCNGINDDCDSRTADGCIDSALTGDTGTAIAPTADTAPSAPTGGATADTGDGPQLPDSGTPPTQGPTTPTTPTAASKGPAPTPPAYGFGCTSLAGGAGPTGLGWWLLAGLALLRRRARS